MVRVGIFSLVCAVLFLTSGCVVVREYAPEKSSVTVSPQEYELARKLLQAFVKNDAETFVSLLPEETRSKFTVESFATTRKAVLESVGEPVAYSYLTTLKLETLHPQVWKVCFKRTNVNKTKEFTSEVLFKVVTGVTGEKEAAVISFHFL